MDINVFARFDEIPSLPVENIKEKSKLCRRMDNVKTFSPLPHPPSNTGL